MVENDVVGERTCGGVVVPRWSNRRGCHDAVAAAAAEEEDDCRQRRWTITRRTEFRVDRDAAADLIGIVGASLLWAKSTTSLFCESRTISIFAGCFGFALRFQFSRILSYFIVLLWILLGLCSYSSLLVQKSPQNHPQFLLLHLDQKKSNECWCFHDREKIERMISEAKRYVELPILLVQI